MTTRRPLSAPPSASAKSVALASLVIGCMVTPALADEPATVPGDLPPAGQHYDLTGFSGVNIARGVDASIRQGPFSVVAASANGEPLDQLYIAVDDGILEVRRKSAFTPGGDDYIQYTVAITAPDYSFIKASTGAHLRGTGLVLSDVEIIANTGADIHLDGACQRANFKADTGAMIEAGALQCDTVKAAARTGADIAAFAHITARGHARLGGQISFDGDPQTRHSGTFLGGDVAFTRNDTD